MARAFRDRAAEGIVERRAGSGTNVRTANDLVTATRQIGLLIPGLGTTERFVNGLIAGRRWDAIICANDLTAAQLIHTIGKCRCRVPQDIRVVGFDDANYATLVSVPLKTIQQPCKDIAVTAFQAMLSRIAEPTLPARKILLAPRLVVRESCGAYLVRRTSQTGRS